MAGTRSDKLNQQVHLSTSLAVACCLYALWYQGAIICHLLDSCSDMMRPIGAGLAALTALVLYVIGRSASSHAGRRLFQVAVIVLSLAAIPLAVIANPISLAFACGIFALSTIWSLGYTMAALSGYGHKDLVKTSMTGALISAFVCIFGSLDLIGPKYWIASLLMGLVPIATVLLTRRSALPVLDRVVNGNTPASIELTEPESFLSVTSRLFVALVLLGCAVGSSYSVLTRLQIQLFGYQLAASVIFIVGIGAARLITHRFTNANTLYWVSIDLAFIGIFLSILWPYNTPIVGPTAIICNLMATLLFYTVIVRLAAVIASRNAFSIAQVATFCVFAVNVGIAADGLMWIGATALRDIPGVSSNLVMVVFLILFMGFNLLFLHGFDFEGTVLSLRQVEQPQPNVESDATSQSQHQPQPEFEHYSETEPEPLHQQIVGPKDEIEASKAPAPSAPTIEDKAMLVAHRYGLTSRETDVAKLLARGYSGVAIQENLVISRNTVKTHVRNVYAKLGVHSQQELIDLVESAHLT